MSNQTLTQTIREDEAVNLAYDRVEKIPSPLLVIGLGGTGKDAVRTLKTVFAQRFVLPRTADGQPIPVPDRTAYLVIDSDANDTDGLDTNEMVDITTVELSKIVKAQGAGLTPDEKTWVNTNLDAVSEGMGAGTYRAAARLMLNRQYARVKTALASALQRICTVEQGASSSGVDRIEIALITGLGGGTGSGTFLDVAQILRHIKATTPTLAGKFLNLTGYIVMPDVTIAHVKNPTMEVPIRRNAFAALKELDFWMDYNTHHTNYVMHYAGVDAVKWEKPFDHCVLLSGLNVNGTAFADGYAMIQHTIAENLLHYMASEQVVGDQFSYRSFEDNLDAQLDGVAAQGGHPLPAVYGYRAIGAYSKRIPKKKILYYEGSLLFGTFMPGKNDRGKYEPNDALLRDGQAHNRALQLSGDLNTFFNNFKGAVKTPAAFGAFDPKDETRLKVMRSMSPRPHQAYDCNPGQWQSSVVRPAALKAADEYLASAWSGFTAFAKEVMSRPELGPFSLYQFLTDEQNGLILNLTGVATSWRAMPNNIRGSLNAYYQACDTGYTNFVKPPLLNGATAVKDYLQKLYMLYDNIRQLEFIEAYARAIDVFVKRVIRYTEDALKPLIATLGELEEEFNDPGTVGDDLGSDLFALNVVKPTLKASFEAENIENHKVTRQFLGEVCNVSFATLPNVDKQSCGLTFTYGLHARLNVMQVLRSEMDACFTTVNDQSLDAIMEQAGCTTVEQKNAWIDALYQSVHGSASPLLALTNGVGSEIHAKCDYLSVPHTSAVTIDRLKQLSDTTNMALKRSSLMDHVYCTTAWDGLPLYQYAEMPAMEEVYNRCRLDKKLSMGMHLVWNGDPEGDHTVNWCRLPSPRPFYFFGEHGDPIDDAVYAKARELAMRALKCGMVTLDDSMPIPVYRFRKFTDGSVLLHNELLMARINEIENRINPVNGEKLSPQSKLALYQELYASAVVTELENGKSPLILAKKLGINVTKADPFKAEIQGNPVALREAKELYHQLSEEMTVTFLLTRPELYNEVAVQLACFEHLNARIEAILGKTRVWDPRMAYAATFAGLIVNGVLDYTRTGGFIYKDPTGANAALMNPSLIADDLKVQTSRHLIACSYLADLSEANETRKYLELILRNVKQDWTQRDTLGMLTDEEVDARIARLDRLIAAADAECRAYMAARMTTEDTATLDKCITVLTGIKQTAEAERSLLS